MPLRGLCKFCMNNDGPVKFVEVILSAELMSSINSFAKASGGYLSTTPIKISLDDSALNIISIRAAVG